MALPTGTISSTVPCRIAYGRLRALPISGARNSASMSAPSCGSDGALKPVHRPGTSSPSSGLDAAHRSGNSSPSKYDAQPPIE